VIVVRASVHSTCFDPDVPSQLQQAQGYVELVAAEADGRFVIDRLPAGARATLIVEVDGEIVRRVAGVCTPEPGDRRKIDVDVTPCRRIHGRTVTPDGEPIGGIELWLTDDGDYTAYGFNASTKTVARRTSDADGRFTFSGLPPAVYRLGLAPAGRDDPTPTFAAALEVLDATSVDPAPLDFVLHEGRSIRGRILGRDGEPAAAWVIAFCSRTGHMIQGHEPHDGAFEIGPLLPNTYWLEARRAGGYRGEAPSERTDVEVGANDVVLRLREGGSIVTRVVHGRTGEPRQAAVAHAEVDTGFYASTRSKEDGHYRAAGLVPGRYVIVARAEDGLIGTTPIIAVEAGQQVEAGEIRLERGARLRVVCTDRRWNTRVRVTNPNGFAYSGALPAPGHLEVFVPTGPITVTVSRPNGREKVVHTLTVVAGRVNRCVVGEGRQ
jgi:protocatechuate 3,4-dioxygenase beta subunit